MLYHVSFSSNLVLPSKDLPLTLISLEDWALIIVNGIDSIKYLQGQLTCDMNSLHRDKFSFAANCNAKGKMVSNLYVFHFFNGIGLIVRRSILDIQIAELKKYAIFSKITIIDYTKVVLLGIAGFKTLSVMSDIFNVNYNTMELSSVIHYKDTTLLYLDLPTPRFLLITTKKTCLFLQDKLKDKAEFNDSMQWLALDIEAGYPIIDRVNIIKFIPQSVNLQYLNGISFNKGCYIGQEIIARAKYRNINKRALYWLVGEYSYIPTIGDNLEIKIDDNWNKTGTILTFCKMKNRSIWIQAVLNNNLSSEFVFRICHDTNSFLHIHKLPYVF